MKLKQWALENGISPQTAYDWYRRGILPVRAEKVGPRTILVFEDPKDTPDRTVIYARVSSAKAVEGLQSQQERLVLWAAEQGLPIAAVYTEVGSGLNDGRKTWNKILADPTITTIVVEHRDRATRFGFDQLQSALRASGRTIRVVDEQEVEDDIVRDMVELLTSLCARFYGKRGAATRANRALEALKEDPSD